MSGLLLKKGASQVDGTFKSIFVYQSMISLNGRSDHFKATLELQLVNLEDLPFTLSYCVSLSGILLVVVGNNYRQIHFTVRQDILQETRRGP